MKEINGPVCDATASTKYWHFQLFFLLKFTQNSRSTRISTHKLVPVFARIFVIFFVIFFAGNFCRPCVVFDSQRKQKLRGIVETVFAKY